MSLDKFTNKIKPISYSELAKWETSPSEWEDIYLEGKRPPPSKAMIMGTDIHSIIAAEDKNVLFEQYAKRLHAGELRVINKILENWVTVCPLQGKYEVKLEATLPVGDGTDEIPLAGFVDFLPDDESAIYEIKTGSSIWTKKRAEEHGQLAFYSAMYFLRYGKAVPTCLVSFSTVNGNVQLHRVEPSIKGITDRIITFCTWLQKYDLTDKRISSKSNARDADTTKAH